MVFFLTNLGKKMLAAELICWQSLLLCCSLPMATYCSHTKPFKNVSSNISILVKGRAKKCPAQVRRCFMGNDQKKKDHRNRFPFTISLKSFEPQTLTS